MTDRRQRIIAEMEDNLAATLDLYASLSDEALSRPVYTEDVQWSVQQVLAHFITIERSMQWLFNNILEGGPGAPENFDLDRFNRTQPAKLDQFNLRELMDHFRDVRAETIAIVRDMAESDLDREGRHAFHGHGTLERFIVWAYEHVRLHTDDLHKALASEAPSN